MAGISGFKGFLQGFGATAAEEVKNQNRIDQEAAAFDARYKYQQQALSNAAKQADIEQANTYTKAAAAGASALAGNPNTQQDTANTAVTALNQPTTSQASMPTDEDTTTPAGKATAVRSLFDQQMANPSTTVLPNTASAIPPSPTAVPASSLNPAAAQAHILDIAPPVKPAPIPVSDLYIKGVGAMNTEETKHFNSLVHGPVPLDGYNFAVSKGQEVIQKNQKEATGIDLQNQDIQTKKQANIIAAKAARVDPLTGDNIVDQPLVDLAPKLGVPVADPRLNPKTNMSQSGIERYDAAVKKTLDKADEKLGDVDTKLADVNHFLQLNAEYKTGGIKNIPIISSILQSTSPEYQTMYSQNKELALNNKPPGLSRMTNMDVTLLRQATLSPTNTPEANDNIANALKASLTGQKEKVDFDKNYFLVNHHMEGADQAYDTYKNANPVFSPDAGPHNNFALNARRLTPQEYFSPDRDAIIAQKQQTTATPATTVPTETGKTYDSPLLNKILQSR